jgi:hypothetical protein
MAGGVWTRSSSERDDGADVGDSAWASGECLVETMRGRGERGAARDEGGSA